LKNLRIVTETRTEKTFLVTSFGEVVVDRNEDFLAEATSQRKSASAESNDDGTWTAGLDYLHIRPGSEPHISQPLLNLFTTHQSINDDLLSWMHEGERYHWTSLLPTFCANAVELHLVVKQGEIIAHGNLPLQRFNLPVVKFLNPAAICAN
jgi:hypothetical protein